MGQFPASGYLSNASRTEGEFQSAIEAFLEATKQVPGAGVTEPTLSIATGILTPTAGFGIFTVDTEGATSSDDLTTIVQTNHPDGSMLLVRCASAARRVTVKHAVGGTGQISLSSAGDFTLGDPRHWLWLKRTGTLWEEIARYPSSNETPINVQIGSYTTVPADRGRVIQCNGTFTVTLLAGATAGVGFIHIIQNVGSGIITLDGNASELIDGLASVRVGPFSAKTIMWNGTGWRSLSEAGAEVPQCGVFERVSTTSCVFKPKYGNRVLINGVIEIIPSAGVSFSNTGLSANTTYYAYVFMNGSTMTGEFSATGRDTDTVTGQEIKSGDATRTLVGIIRTNASSQFMVSDSQRFVTSWFNPRPRYLTASLSTDRATTSGVAVELEPNSRIEFVTFADRSVMYGSSSRVLNDSGGIVTTYAGLDGTAGRAAGSVHPASSEGSHSVITVVSPTDGYHYFTFMGATSAGTSTWRAGGYTTHSAMLLV